MLVTLSGMVMLPDNSAGTINISVLDLLYNIPSVLLYVVLALSTVMLVSLEQLENVPIPMLVTLFDIATVTKLGQLKIGKVVISSGIIKFCRLSAVRLSKEVQPFKSVAPIVVLGNLRDFNLEHPLKASNPTFVTFLGIFIFLISEQL